MRKQYKKFLGMLMSFFMVFTIICTNITGVQAYEASENTRKNQEIKCILRETLKEYKDEHQVLHDADINKDEIVTFIVEIDEKAIKDYVGNRSLKEGVNEELIEKVLDSQKFYKDEIKKINSEAVFTNEYTLLINGFSVQAKKSDMEKIQGIKGVKHISIAKKYHRDVKSAVDLNKIEKIYKELGYNGEGMVVSVIDSGIDYTHKDMILTNSNKAKLTKEKVEKINKTNPKSKGKYFTEKIPYGYNFADKNCEVIDKATNNIGYMHGMHVAGIVGANCQKQDEINKNKGVKGVAPECQILAMKIFSNDENKSDASEEQIIAAIEDSVIHGADVINMSFCSTSGFQDPEDGQQVAVREAIKKGVVVVAAAGNSYYSTYPNKHENVLDIGAVGAPGLVHDSIQVASLNNSIRTTYALSYDSNDEQGTLPYVDSDLNIRELKGKYEIVDCGLGYENDLENKNLSGKIALIKRGKIQFKDKKLNAQNKGAKAVIIYNKDNDESYLDNISTDKNVFVPTIFIKNSDGIKLKELISKGVKVSFNNEAMQIPNKEELQLSEFSSWGPTPNLDLKPDITGIGGNLWSTVNNNNYKNMFGTSMASPYIAGISTLILQHVNNMNIKFDSNQQKVKFIKTLMMNTAVVQKNKEHGNLPYSPRRQGAGFVNVENALKNKVTLTYKGQPSAPLKVIDKVTEIPLELKNYGDKTVTYNIEASSGILTEVDKVKGGMPYEVELKDAHMEFNKSKGVTVKPGEIVKINTKLILGEGVSKNRFVEGFIRFNPVDSNVCAIGMPFMGFYGGWDELQILDDPIYTGKSIFGETSLYTAKQDFMGYKTYRLGGDDKVKPEHFAINPEDPHANINAMPQISFLRNAKNLKIELTDAKGKVLKLIEDKNNVKKEIPIEQQIASKVNFEWLWDGKLYDKYKGEKVPVEEGQYYFNIRVKVDTENAKEQVLTMPIKVDKTAPIVKAPNICIADSDNCNIEFEAYDEENGSGIDKFLFLVDMKKYMEDKGQKMFKLTPYANAKNYSKNIKLPVDSGKSFYNVTIGSTDYADNMGYGNAFVIYPKNSKLNMSFSKASYKSGEDIFIQYKPHESYKSLIDHYEILIDNLDSVKTNNKNLYYNITNGLSEGAHNIVVKAVDSDGKILDANGVKIMVEKGEKQENPNNEVFEIQDLTQKKSFSNGENAEVKIRAANLKDSKSKISLILCLYDDKNSLVNVSIIEKNVNASESVILSSSLYIPKKSNLKLKAFLWDSIDDLYPMCSAKEYKVIDVAAK